MPSTKEIRRRIRSVKSTKQITKAMELVAAAKMRKAQLQTVATRSYARLAWELIRNLTDKTDPRLHKLLRSSGGKTVAILLITSNRGLIGGFNSRIIETGLDYVKQFAAVEFVTLGKKGRGAVRKAGFFIAADFEKNDATSSVSDVRAVADLLINDFLTGKYGRVVLVYMDFVSTLVQKPKILELLPLSDLSPNLSPSPGERNKTEFSSLDYLFEPTADVVLEHVLPKLTIMQIYQALLETNAAEHSARMVAMKSASDAAGDLISDLTLEYNQIRQANITKEISEIVSGKLALTTNY